MVGAREEAVEAAGEALRLARQTGDQRCQAYAHMALAEAQLDAPHAASDHLTRSSQLLGADSTADGLRVGALQLALNQEVNLAACDARASDSSVSAEARLVWWGARARQLLGSWPGASGRRGRAAARHLGQLARRGGREGPRLCCRSSFGGRPR